MMATPVSLLYRVLLISLNVGAAVAIVLLNKLLFRAWPFALALTAVHAIFTQAGTRALRTAGAFEAVTLPAAPVARMALCGVASIVLMNISLALNPIGIFQASKILIVPATAVLERVMLGRRAGWRVLVALAAVCAGVALSAPPDVLTSLEHSRASLMGLAVAAAAVLVASTAVILIGATQKQLSASPLALLDAQQRYVIVYALVMTIIFEDWSAAMRGVADNSIAVLVVVTAALSVALNASGFAVLQLLSPLSYQVTSHLKTVATLALGVSLFGETMLARQAAGFALSIAGVVAYAAARASEAKDVAAAAENSTSKESPRPFLYTRQRSRAAFAVAIICAAALVLGTFGGGGGGVSVRVRAPPYFEPLSPSFAQAPNVSSAQWDVIVCSHARLEAPLLREWVLWNAAAGVQHFVIYDNNDAAPDGLRDAFDEALAPFPASLVTTARYPRDVMNNPAMAPLYGLDRADFDSLDVAYENPLKQRCFDDYSARAKWIAFIDVDEVFVAVQEGLSLPAFLARPAIADDASIGGVGVFWRMNHYSGHFLRPVDGLLAGYGVCEPLSHPMTNKHIKTIVRGQTAEPVMTINNAHFMNYAPGRRCVTEPELLEDGCDYQRHLLNASFRRPASVHFQLNHYYARSVEDFIAKTLRGSYFGDALQAEHHLRHIGNGAYASNCAVALDVPTLRASAAAAALRARLHVPLGPAAAPLPPLPPAYRAWSPVFSAFYDAVASRKVWDEAFYLRENAGRPECQPTPPLDALLLYWIRDATNVSTGACSARFI